VINLAIPQTFDIPEFDVDGSASVKANHSRKLSYASSASPAQNLSERQSPNRQYVGLNWRQTFIIAARAFHNCGEVRVRMRNCNECSNCLNVEHIYVCDK
jgi:hypothetical protein